LIRTTITHADYLLAPCLLNGYIVLREALKDAHAGKLVPARLYEGADVLEQACKEAEP
jgi:hypothetical protein